jgi:hypothetical protein
MNSNLKSAVVGAGAAGAILLGVYFLLAVPGAAVSTSLETATSVGTGAGTRSIIVNNKGRICAEPSPDIMSSLVSNVEMQGEGGGDATTTLKGLIKAAQTSSGEPIFERSQGIQALRDGMYRLCEAHLNDAIPKDTYVEQMTDLVATLNFIVPIELCSQLSRDLAKSGVANVSGREGKQKVSPDDLQTEGKADMSNGLSAMTAILLQCIQTSYQFGANIAKNSGERGKARLQAEVASNFEKFRIAYALREMGMPCDKIREVSGGTLECLMLQVSASPEPIPEVPAR